MSATATLERRSAIFRSVILFRRPLSCAAHGFSEGLYRRIFTLLHFFRRECDVTPFDLVSTLPLFWQFRFTRFLSYRFSSDLLQVAR